MIEEQHPIPQQVSAYQFKLVGDMTLNQFFQVAGGALFSLMLYASSLAPYIKWPLIFLSFLAGIAFAFFPLQDRPLLTWLILFFKAIYSPTIYIWKKGSEKRVFFAPEGTVIPGAPSQLTASTDQSSAASTKKTSSAVKDKTRSPLDKEETKFLQKIDQQIQTPIPTTSVKDTSLPIPTAKSTQTTQIKATSSAVKPGEKGIVIPKGQEVIVEKSSKTKDIVTSPLPISGEVSVPTPITQSQVKGATPADFVPETTPPAVPNVANVIVGQVLERDGKIIPNTILEILDSQGRPVRALKSNRLGHFLIVTPLANGDYILKAEHEGFVFTPISFKAKGKVIQPIAVFGRKKTDKENK